MNTWLRKALPSAASLFIVSLSLILAAPRSQSQTQADSSSDHWLRGGAAAGDSSSVSISGANAEIPPAVAKELAAMKERIAQLEAELGKSKVQPAPAVMLTSAQSAALSAASASATDTAAVEPTKPKKIEPFSDWDWTWLNGNPRNKDVAWDSKFFTPEIRADVTYTYDFNRPQDDSMGGSSELFRSNEIQLEQLGVGGDFHWENVRARLLTQFGMYSTATVRNDPSSAKGQWNINDADRYLAEAYGGYHLDVLDGINLDAGIFMSYVGLFSYYNFDNWAYQPSYVSSNTPWFFEGVRIQIFPNPHLKVEPWFINGWQSYGSSNNRKGLGGQLKWTPRPWINIISNEYGLGHDDLYTPGRSRIHTDNSVEVKYYDHPEKMLDKMAFTFTGDLGCEFGPSTITAGGQYIQGVSCLGNTRDPKSVGQNTNANNQNPADPNTRFLPGINPKQSFVGYMLYDRTWFHKDLFAVTVGGGQINNPGRYLVLVPPINGETAASAALSSPYFTFNPADRFKAWDTSLTFDYMPKQWLTFRWEYDFRHANVPYWSGAGGVTPPPGTNNGFPSQYVCAGSGATGLATAVPLTVANPAAFCAGNGGLWGPDLRKNEALVDFDIMVKF